MRTIALHGDMATPAMLRRDMGNPPWVTEYFDGQGWARPTRRAYTEELANSIQSPVVLIGYSRGGQIIADLTADERVRRLIQCAVVYEAPIGRVGCFGDFPVLMVWNNRGALKKLSRIDDCIDSMASWSEKHPATLMIGNGFHVHMNPLAHGWDKELNSRIADWIQKQTNSNLILV